jgi:hypothetical protein
MSWVSGIPLGNCRYRAITTRIDFIESQATHPQQAPKIHIHGLHHPKYLQIFTNSSTSCVVLSSLSPLPANSFAGIEPRRNNPWQGVLNYGRCGPSSAITAACAAFVFRVCHQDAARWGRTANPVGVAHVAFGRRQDAHRHGYDQRHLRPNLEAHHRARSR